MKKKATGKGKKAAPIKNLEPRSEKTRSIKGGQARSTVKSPLRGSYPPTHPHGINKVASLINPQP